VRVLNPFGIWAIVLTLLSAAEAGVVVSDFVRPVGVTASNQYVSGTRKAVFTIDGSGLSALGQHGTSADNTMWMTDPLPTAWIQYDLGAPLQLSGFHLWNHNQGGFTDRGIQTAKVYTSLDGSNWTSGEDFTLARASGATTYAGEDYAFAAPVSARYVKIESQSTFVVGNNYIGLSEARFTTPRWIDGVTATASSNYGSRTAAKTVDDSGMSGFGLERADINADAGMWMTDYGNIVGRTITFDLQDVHSLQAARVWNFNMNNGTSYSQRGIETLDIAVSLDGITYQTLTGPSPGGHFSLTQAPGAANYLTADMLDLDRAIGRYVRFTVLDYFGTNPNGDYVGLSEVRFYEAVPEPSALALCFVGAGALAIAMRRCVAR